MVRKAPPLKLSKRRRSRMSGRKVFIGAEVGTSNPIGLSNIDRGSHTHIIGSTGTGKSKILEHLIRQSLDRPNEGLCLIDPHGELYDDIVQYCAEIRPELAERVVLINPAAEDDGHVP
ncbi:helicase HerA domain-containing protein [Terasakiella sp.]|uniref:helicase HerA domain-containing protein n=1 Tax=Terasakiella sp. TaxID=2034861 RepID=UPI003AA7D085